VTGAGGSIGSELCRQISTFKPATLVETLEPSGSEKIFRVQASVESEPVFVQMHKIATLIAAAENGQTTCVIEQLGEVVPTFRRSRSSSVPAQSRQPGTVTPFRNIAGRVPATTALPQT
jgi:hypothetical protein